MGIRTKVINDKKQYAGYFYYYDQNNKRRQKQTIYFPKKREAVEALEKLKIEFEVDLSPWKERPFYEWFQHWYTTNKEKKAPSNSAREQYKLAGKCIKKYFGDTKLGDMTKDQYINGFMNVFGPNHSKEHVRKIHQYIKSCVKEAKESNIIKVNFTYNVALIYDPEKTRTEKVEYLNMNELARLRKYVSKNLNANYPSRYMILTAMYTGARVSEIRGLQWKNIDFVNGSIYIENQLSEQNRIKKVLTRPKTKSSKRKVPAPQQLLDYLKELEPDTLNHGNEFVFIDQFNTIPSGNANNKCLKSIMKRAGLLKEDKTFTMHSLRHSFVAYHIAKGRSIDYISHVIGHNDPSITWKRYSYLMDELRDDEATAMKNSYDF